MVNFKMTTKYGAMASAVFASFVVAGVYFVRVSTRRKQEPPKQSMSIAVLHGGQLALKRLVEYQKARAEKCAQLEQAESDLKTHLINQHPDYKKLQSIIAKLEMSEKEAEAVKILENAIIKARNEKKWHEAYEIEMLLVEMLINKGDFDEASERECLKHKEISDARRPLYMAIMLKRDSMPKEVVHQYWEEFNSLNGDFHCELDSAKESLDKLRTDFDEFENVINDLKNNIEVHEKKTIK